MRYYFVLADSLRTTKRKTLPALQTLLDDPETRDWIISKQINLDDACRGVYKKDHLAVSHRWLTEGTPDPRRAPPDPKGVQLKAIQDYLAEHPEIKYVWVDWLCMWQADKEGQRQITPQLRAEFDQMISEVNVLYLGCGVLALLDLSYLSRFWTTLEAWLASQKPTPSGLTLDPQRLSIKPILGANHAFSMALEATMSEALMSPASAIDYLFSYHARAVCGHSRIIAESKGFSKPAHTHPASAC